MGRKARSAQQRDSACQPRSEGAGRRKLGARDPKTHDERRGQPADRGGDPEALGSLPGGGGGQSQGEKRSSQPGLDTDWMGFLQVEDRLGDCAANTEIRSQAAHVVSCDTETRKPLKFATPSQCCLCLRSRKYTRSFTHPNKGLTHRSGSLKCCPDVI